MFDDRRRLGEACAAPDNGQAAQRRPDLHRAGLRTRAPRHAWPRSSTRSNCGHERVLYPSAHRADDYTTYRQRCAPREAAHGSSTMRSAQGATDRRAGGRTRACRSASTSRRRLIVGAHEGDGGDAERRSSDRCCRWKPTTGARRRASAGSTRGRIRWRCTGSAALWDHLQRVLRETRAGGVTLNDTLWRSPRRFALRRGGRVRIRPLSRRAPATGVLASTSPSSGSAGYAPVAVAASALWPGLRPDARAAAPIPVVTGRVGAMVRRRAGPFVRKGVVLLACLLAACATRLAAPDAPQGDAILGALERAEGDAGRGLALLRDRTEANCVVCPTRFPTPHCRWRATSVRRWRTSRGGCRPDRSGCASSTSGASLRAA